MTLLSFCRRKALKMIVVRGAMRRAAGRCEFIPKLILAETIRNTHVSKRLLAVMGQSKSVVIRCSLGMAAL